MSVADWLARQWFGIIHQNQLVYNACWEDPRLDRVALQLGPDDVVAVITSAGCNALDYVLTEPRHVHAIDCNVRQNALLELKIAAIRGLDFTTYFAIFGRGRLGGFRQVYQRALRPQLTVTARTYWDRHQGYFSGPKWRPSFYFHGTAGVFARLINLYVDRVAKIRDDVTAMLMADTLEEQRTIYERDVRQAFWKSYLDWFIGHDTTLSLVGVPRAQRLQVERHYAGGIAQFIRECCEAVFVRIPLRDNYFWRVYLTGEYAPDCCPEYLKEANFHRLKAGLVDRISIHTTTLAGFLESHQGRISRFVLLDHMDWLATLGSGELQREWQAIVRRAAPNARCLWRSGGLQVDYVDPLFVRIGRESHRLGDLLTYDRALAERLRAQDRVHTYGSFHVADLAV